jgi:hypothetical protein
MMVSQFQPNQSQSPDQIGSFSFMSHPLLNLLCICARNENAPGRESGGVDSRCTTHRGLGLMPQRILPTHSVQSNWRPSVLRKYIGASRQSHAKGNSGQAPCRELTLVAASGSERPLSANPPGDRVDFIPKGILGIGLQLSARRGVIPHRVTEPLTLQINSLKYPPVWSFGVVRAVVRHPEVTERYPPYSRLALERGPTKTVGGEAEAECCP